MNGMSNPELLPPHRLASRVLLDRLMNGEPVSAIGVRSARSAEVARLAKASGHDAIWVDLEHSTMPIDTAAAICACALDIGLFPLVRIPERDYGVIGRLLDGGALGLIAPRIETAEQAADLVSASRFPPQGHRSAVAQLALFGYERVPAARLNEAANASVLVKVLIESPLGISNIEAIAAVPGIDLIGIGTNELCAELGVPGEYRNAEVQRLHALALDACRRIGKPLAIGGIADAAYNAELIRKGAAPFLMTGIDTEMFLATATERVRSALAALQ